MSASSLISNPRRPMAAIAVGLVALGAAACGNLDSGKLESEIKKQGTGVQSVDCPEVEAKKGKNFQCDVTLQGGTTAKVNVTQTDDNGNVKFALDPSTLKQGK